MRALLALTAMTALAHAQLVTCDECARGNALLDALGDAGATVRANPGVLAEAERIQIEQEPLSINQLRRLTAWKQQLPSEMTAAIAAIASKPDDERLAIGFALCNGHEINCARHLALALNCAVAGCDVDRPPPLDPDNFHKRPCDPFVEHVRSPRVGFGLEYGTGWLASAEPVEGRVWSLGLEGRVRLRKRLGLVARLDFSRSRDEARDDDGDGRDDLSTGGVSRWTALAGPSVLVDVVEDQRLVRYVQFDLLGGYLWSRDSGPVLAADLSYQLVIARLGLRYTESFTTERALVAHMGFEFGAGPEFSVGGGCGEVRRPSSHWALGLELLASGYSLEGYVAPGIALEAARHVSRRFDVLLHADLMAFTRGSKDRALHQTMLAGGRWDFSKRRPSQNVGFFATVMGGYAHVTAPTSSAIKSNVVGDVSLGWGGQGGDGAGYIRLHARFGLTPENLDLFAVVLAIGTELRFDRDTWSDRRLD